MSKFGSVYMHREKMMKKNILCQKRLVLYNYAEEAAKYYMDFLKKHQEEDPECVHFEIEQIKLEEDYYGNGGGYEYFINIYKEVKENDDEFNIRISEGEKKLKSIYINELNDLTDDFLDKMTNGLDKKDKERYIKDIAEKMPNVLRKLILGYELFT